MASVTNWWCGWPAAQSAGPLYCERQVGDADLALVVAHHSSPSAGLLTAPVIQRPMSLAHSQYGPFLGRYVCTRSRY